MPETAAGLLRKPGGEQVYSQRRVEKDEERRANESGFGITRQAEAVYRKYGEPLEGLITAKLIDGRRSGDVWAALSGGIERPVKDLAERLLKLGLTVAYASSIGVNRKEDNRAVKNARNVLLWLGDKLSQLQQKDTELEAHIGGCAVNLLLHLTDLFTLDENKVLILSQTESFVQLRGDVIKWAAYNNPYLLPSTKPSAPWTGVRQGPVGSQIPLVSRRYSEAAVQQAIENGERREIDGHMWRVLEAINALQDVWFVINEPVLNIAKQLPPEISPPPEKGLTPSDLAKQKRQFQRARTKARNYHADLELADIVAERGRFNVPHEMDFRGRVLGIPHFNYQRGDHIRGLFLSADGERLGDHGLPWLKYHVAGCADGNTWSDNRKPSKLSFDDRIAWTERNLERLCKIADDVLNGVVPERQWLPEDKVQFLAACVELKQALDTTPVSDFMTTLPISFDGCCSGLQHFCGLTRAPEGRLAGLTPSEVAEDFYTEVVKRVRDANSEIMNGSDNRMIVKQPTQTYFYGAGWETMCEQIEEALYDLGREADPPQITKLAKAIYKACGDLAPAAKKVRKFVGRLAWLYANEGLVFRWQSKLGFPVIHEYHKPNVKPGIAVRFGRTRLDMNLTIGDLPEFDADTSRRAATANFIHSLDAAHLHEVVWVASKRGIRMVTVHDCFACLAPRAAELNHIIRERFIAVHALSFVMLEDMLAAAKRDLPDVELPELPINRGPYLNLVQVLKSPGWT